MAISVSDATLQHLLEKQAITAEQATNVQQKVKDGQKLKDVLVGEIGIDEEVFMQSYAAAMGMEYVNLADVKIPKEVLGVIPESTARGHMIIAYEQTPELLKLAMADPSDRQIVEFIHKKVDMPVSVALTTEDGIRNALGLYQETLEAELGGLVEQAKALITNKGEGQPGDDLPTIKIVESILKHAILQEASDIHIEPTEKQVVIRYRIDGMLRDVLILPKTVLAGLVARIKVLSNLKIDEHRLPQDGRFKMESEDYKVAFRVSTLPVFDGEKIVMRLLDESGHGLTLDDMGMTPRTLDIFRRNVNKPHGMVLVTGPTGSGKTTTLYAAMRELNQPDVNISTVEDPIEYRMERINQTQVQPQIGLTFSNGLRALVRQDPDIIMVGEIRDEETAALAVNASLTGHLVLSTLHTNSAAGAVPRLMDMAVEPFLIASTANILLAQRLVRKLCPDCKKEAALDAAILDSIKLVVNDEELLEVLHREEVIPKDKTWGDMKIFMPQGCNKCTDGYKGRLGIYEVLEVTPEIQKLITTNVTAQVLEDTAKKSQQMVTMIQDGLLKVIQGVTTVEEVLRVAKE